MNGKTFVAKKTLDIGQISVRRAEEKDVEAIYEIACSVSIGERDSYKGFLMDDYPDDPEYYIEYFRDKVINIEYFFVAELGEKIVGFSLSYRKDKWLSYNPDWLDVMKWHPEFDKSFLDNFVYIDKTAILAGHTGEGVGSLIYKEIIKKMKSEGIEYIFSETIVAPIPNFASLSFRKKQKYHLAGMRYEPYKGTVYTDLVYWKKI